MTPLLLLAPLSGAPTLAAPPPGAVPAIELPCVELSLALRPTGAEGSAPQAELIGLPRAGRLELTVDAAPGASVLVGLAAGSGADGWIFDQAELLLLNGPDGARASAEGRLRLDLDVPGGLDLGARLSIQAVSIDSRLGLTAASPPLDLLVEERLDFDFRRSTGGWTPVTGAEHLPQGWQLDPQGSIARLLTGLDALGEYRVEGMLRVESAAELWVGATPDQRHPDQRHPSADAARTPIRFTADHEGRAWLSLQNPHEDLTRIRRAVIRLTR
jgi:hypothetical protein